jgi:allantoinase
MEGIVIRSRNVVTPAGVQPASIRVSAGRIDAVDSYAAQVGGSDVVDYGDLYILPGLVDSHIHLNEPGRTEWEGFETGTRAAAAGGYTSLVDMPLNNLPETTTAENLRIKAEAVQGKATIDYGFWGGAGHDNQAHIEELAAAGVLGFKCFLVHCGIEGFTHVTEEQLRAALPAIARTRLPLLVHAELPGPLDAANPGPAADWFAYRTYLASRPPAAEIEAIRMMIRLSREFGVRVHIVHLSAAGALADLKAARAEGLPITVETCPHYLCFAAEEIPDGGTIFKCAPPIREHSNRELLWQALLDGDIDLVATDHSPCPPEMKSRGAGDFSKVWCGVASVQVSFSAMWTQASRRGIPLERLAQWMSSAPAGLAGLRSRKGSIEPGKDADLVVFDPRLKWTLSAADLFTRHAISPYIGQPLLGKVQATWLRGMRIYDHGSFSGLPYGIRMV